jgi:peptidoglycan/LPS O-acetylase OafA/YrhL
MNVINKSEVNSGFRGDIQGLRAVAVFLVLVYHIWPGSLSGGYVGVDVFFVISGFLITSMLARDIEVRGKIHLLEFYARRARRLMPAATVVLVVCGAAAVLFLPPTRYETVGREVAASALYLQNINLFLLEIDYLTQDTPPGPFRHYWSLSIEEQFYIFWPLLFGAVTVVGGAVLRTRLKATLTATIGAIVIASLTASAFYTALDPASAYFLPWTRFWELGIGGLVALLSKGRTLSKPFSAFLGWGGLAAILYAAFSFDDFTPFPGYAALLPVLGTAAMLLAGNADHPFSPKPLLSIAPARRIGDLSYSLYLWHWPLIVFYKAWYERAPDAISGLGLAALSMLLADLTLRLIENPARHSKWAASRNTTFLLSAALMAVSLIAAFLIWTAAPPNKPLVSAPLNDEANRNHPGAIALANGSRPPENLEVFIPSPSQARADNAALYGDGCHVPRTSATPTPCVYGPDSAETIIALVGDSHAAQHLPALRHLAEQHGFKIITHTRSSCAFMDVDVLNGNGDVADPLCRDWVRNVVDELTALQPDLVVTARIAQIRAVGGASGQENLMLMTSGLTSLWLELEDAGIPVLPIQSTPMIRLDVPDCVSAAPQTYKSECGRDREAAILGRADPVIRAAEELGLESVDLNEFICEPSYCPPIVGNVLVYRDQHHLTATYSRTMAFAFEPFILRALGD